MTTLTTPVQGMMTDPPANGTGAEMARQGPMPGGGAKRAALRDLIALATESVATETQLDRRRDTSLATAAEEWEKAQWTLAQRQKSGEDQARQRHAERLAEIEKMVARESAELKAWGRQAQLTIAADSEPMERKIREKRDHDVWMADSVYEVAHNQLLIEAKKSKEEYQTRLDSADAMAARASSLLNKFGVSLSPADLPNEPAALTGEEADNAPIDVAAAQSAGAYAARLGEAEQKLSQFALMRLPRLFAGVTPYLAVLGLTAAAGLITFGILVAMGAKETPMTPALIACGAAFVLSLGIGFLLRSSASKQVRQAYVPLRVSIGSTRQAAWAELQASRAIREARDREAMSKRDREAQAAKARLAPVVQKAAAKRKAAEAAAIARRDAEAQRIVRDRDQARKDAEQALAKSTQDVQSRYATELKASQTKQAAQVGDAGRQFQEARGALERRLHDGLASIRVPFDGDGGAGRPAPSPRAWDDAAWTTWRPPRSFATAIRFGDLHVDLRKIAESANVPAKAAEPLEDGEAAPPPKTAAVRLPLPEAFAVPATLDFPQGASLLIDTDREGRDDAVNILQTVMARLLTSEPAGRVRFTILDPVGLGQNFAGFMHLADYDDALVSARIWTEAEQIDRRLADLTEHMETVIQKYLRNEFATIDQYNEQAGELAEPYRFLVIADFPAGFSADALRRLASIVSSGPRCGVYTLIVRDVRQDIPSGMHIEDIRGAGAHLVRREGRFVWDDEVFGRFPLSIDAAPTAERLTPIVHIVGKNAKEASRVEVPFDQIAPPEEQFWTRSSASEMRVPVGRFGATRLQEMRLGKGVAQHVLIAGKTGSGKSTLLHAIVTNLALWYSPDEVEFYLIDFKKGVEFKAYATEQLPHARAIAVESDREFGVSVLQRLDAELTRRGELYRKVGVQDLASYRQSPGALRMPRTLLMIDEFQEFFTEDDKLAAEAGLLMDRLVRQGRAFGIHVILGSQTIGGATGLARSTLGQMAVRVALQTSEADSQLILGDGNSAARLLTRPGEAIYNDQGGLVEANSPFQVAWLPDERREQFLKRVRAKAEESYGGTGMPQLPEPLVFEGNAVADVTGNRKLAAMLAAATVEQPNAARAFLGDPVAIKEASAVTFRRQSGSNLLLIGQQDDAAMAILATSVVGLAAQHPPGGAVFYLLDGSPADSPLAGELAKVAAAIPHTSHVVEYRNVPDAIDEVSRTIQHRQATGEVGPEIYVLIYALQRYRSLRKSEDSFSFSMDAEKKADPGKQFADMLRDGPPAGVHILAWVDTPVSLERTLDRGSLREFDNRVLFQMSANDSSNLIDSPTANKLGPNRALVYSEEQGVAEKFRPYGLPAKPWLEHVRTTLAGRTPILLPSMPPVASAAATDSISSPSFDDAPPLPSAADDLGEPF